VHECYENNDNTYVLLNGEKVISYFERDDGKTICRYVNYRNKNGKYVSRLIEKIIYEIDEEGYYDYYKVYGDKKEKTFKRRRYKEIIPPFKFLLSKNQIVKCINKKADNKINDLIKVLIFRIARSDITEPLEIIKLIKECLKDGY
jgi:hypothetical protein